MDNKVLFVATVDQGHILKFHLPYLKYFKENGYEVHVACAGNAEIPYCDIKHELTLNRSPLKLSNFKAYKELKKIIDNNSYKIIHCHTPVGGVIGRLAAKNTRYNGTKVLYTGHGFHFYKGASVINWLLYYPIEKWLAKYTDCLITINNEDYENVIKKRFNVGNVQLVNGVGVDLNKFSPQTIEEKNVLRKEYNFSNKDFILLYTAELNENKNQELIINACNLLKNRIPNLKLLLAGDGILLDR